MINNLCDVLKMSFLKFKESLRNCLLSSKKCFSFKLYSTIKAILLLKNLKNLCTLCAF